MHNVSKTILVALTGTVWEHFFEITLEQFPVWISCFPISAFYEFSLEFYFFFYFNMRIGASSISTSKHVKNAVSSKKWILISIFSYSILTFSTFDLLLIFILRLYHVWFNTFTEPKSTSSTSASYDFEYFDQTRTKGEFQYQFFQSYLRLFLRLQRWIMFKSRFFCECLFRRSIYFLFAFGLFSRLFYSYMKTYFAKRYYSKIRATIIHQRPTTLNTST